MLHVVKEQQRIQQCKSSNASFSLPIVVRTGCVHEFMHHSPFAHVSSQWTVCPAGLPVLESHSLDCPHSTAAQLNSVAVPVSWRAGLRRRDGVLHRGMQNSEWVVSSVKLLLFGHVRHRVGGCRSPCQVLGCAIGIVSSPAAEECS